MVQGLPAAAAAGFYVDVQYRPPFTPLHSSYHTGVQPSTGFTDNPSRGQRMLGKKLKEETDETSVLRIFTRGLLMKNMTGPLHIKITPLSCCVIQHNLAFSLFVPADFIFLLTF
jgi:hypothetical protein